MAAGRVCAAQNVYSRPSPSPVDPWCRGVWRSTWRSAGRARRSSLTASAGNSTWSPTTARPASCPAGAALVAWPASLPKVGSDVQFRCRRLLLCWNEHGVVTADLDEASRRRSGSVDIAVSTPRLYCESAALSTKSSESPWGRRQRCRGILDISLFLLSFNVAPFTW